MEAIKTMKVINYTEGKLAATFMEASNMNDDSLQRCIDRLKSHNADILIIANDFAPLSFTFGMYVRHESGEYVIEGERCSRYMNGGIIFHGKHDNGGDGSAPTFSVSLTPCNGWSIHT